MNKLPTTIEGIGFPAKTSIDIGESGCFRYTASSDVSASFNVDIYLNGKKKRRESFLS